MGADPLQQFLDVLRESRLLDAKQWAELPALRRCGDVRALARELVRRGWLTPYQANQVARGRGKDLTLGPYVLLEPLGEGGMGQVFKARHPLMKRVVALKLIRAERLQHGDALSRFQREIVAAGRLSHPNVIIAHDAVQVGRTICLVMEFAEGTDLGKLLKQRGPLPVAEACEYVRQAALGLQHAHEQGLVHRDVKPGNLLLTRPGGAQAGGVVKVLDLGLARLGTSADEDSATALTGASALMGTPDYMAPEQAGDAHAVDIRADIYSLGCTLYALLTGRAPFAGTQLTQKILAHLSAEPPPLESMRTDVPPALAAVVRRLMAKQAEQRYQTPADVAAALAPFCGPAAAAVPAAVLALPAEPAPTSSHDASTVAFGEPEGATPGQLAAPATVPPAAAGKLPRWLVPAGVGAALLLVLLVWLVAGAFRGGGPQRQDTAQELPARRPPLELDPDAPTVAIRTFEGHAAQVNSVALSADGRRALSGSADRTVRLWDAKTGEQLHSFKANGGIWSVALSPDGKYALAGEGEWWEGGEWKKAPRYDVILWDLSTRNVTRPFTGYKWDFKWAVLGVAFHPNGRQLLADTLGDGVWLAERDGSRPLRRVSTGGGSFSSGLLSADGRRALLLDANHTLRLWNAETWEVMRVLKGHKDNIRSVAISADGRRALSSGWDRTVLLWELPGGRELRRLVGQQTIVTGLAVSPDGRWGATGAGTIPAPDGNGARNADFDHVIRLYDLETGKEVRRFEGHTSGIMSLAFSADGRYLLSGACDATLRLWRWAK
jgi:WD40 repeat protein/tRNA A-37 threonylcarbamoyl transferase component Bud32